jgi:putative acetyltransferase
MVIIRTEQTTDIPQVRIVNELAFGRAAEAGVVDRLRHAVACADALSLVAEEGGAVVGRILFTPALIEGAGRRVVGMGLAPLAVLPDHQGQGIGSTLVRHGLKIPGERYCPFIIVLGHPAYYSRFGFERASQHGLACQWEVPDEAFMVLILDAAALAGVSGEARYRAEFDEAM